MERKCYLDTTKDMFVVQARDKNDEEPLFNYVVKAKGEYEAIQIAKNYFDDDSIHFTFSAKDFQWSCLWLDAILE